MKNCKWEWNLGIICTPLRTTCKRNIRRPRSWKIIDRRSRKEGRFLNRLNWRPKGRRFSTLLRKRKELNNCFLSRSHQVTWCDCSSLLLVKIRKALLDRKIIKIFRRPKRRLRKSLCTNQSLSPKPSKNLNPKS
mgnify:CR=1 FL=1